MKLGVHVFFIHCAALLKENVKEYNLSHPYVKLLCR